MPFPEIAEVISFLDEMSVIEGRSAVSGRVIKEQYLCREPEERLFFKGRWYEGLYPNIGATEEDKRQFAEFQKQIDRWVDWRDAKGKRSFVVPVGMCSTDAEVTSLDKISFAEWLRQNGFTSERLIWY